LCGPGNNGGDGFVVARLLKEWGWEVEVFLYGDVEKLPPDARMNYERWGALGKVRSLTNEAIDGYAEDRPHTSVAIDALFGTGLKRPFFELGRIQDELNYWQAASKNKETPKVVAVDMPSGICADSGLYIGYHDENPFDSCVMANLTVTFHSKKLGHRLSEGPIGCGRVRVKQIGLDKWKRQEPNAQDIVRFSTEPKSAEYLPSWRLVEKLHLSAHKYTHGHALILSGPSGKGGAARLAARGALRIGAGLVTVAPTPGALQENAARLDAIMLSPVGDAPTLKAVLADERLNALCLGPGLGQERARELVPVALRAKRPTVLDADALTAFADKPQVLFDMLHENCVLTPHQGEFAQLFPDIAEKLNAPATKGPAYSKADATREAAARAGCVVVFKGE